MCNYSQNDANNIPSTRDKDWRLFYVNVIFILVCMLPPQLLGAENGTNNDQLRANEIMANAPKSPEEFLVRLKTLLQKQKNNGPYFAEELTGIKMDKWKTSPHSEYASSRYYSFNLGEALWKNIEVDKWPKLENRPITKFWPALFVDNYKDNIFFTFLTTFNNYEKRDNLLCITPQGTKTIFGEPEKITSSIGGDSDARLCYIYKITNFKLKITYHVDVDHSELGSDIYLLEDFNNHKNLCAFQLQVEKIDPIKIKNTRDDPTWVQEISDNVARNPDQLMHALVVLWDNYADNIHDFAEKVTRASMAKWTEREGRGKSIGYNLYVEKEEYPDFPYAISITPGQESADKFSFNMALRPFKYKGIKYKNVTDRIICITPEKTKEFLGEPSKISGKIVSRREFMSSTIYTYEKENQTLEFSYPNPGGVPERYINFSQHKNFCANSIQLQQN